MDAQTAPPIANSRFSIAERDNVESTPAIALLQTSLLASFFAFSAFQASLPLHVWLLTKSYPLPAKYPVVTST